MSAGPRTLWGWHRLADDWAGLIVARCGVRPGDLVLDIGAGTGAITSALLDVGARVVAVELHPGRAAELRRRFADERVIVVQADATELRLPRQPFRVVANPPFAATTGILRRLLDPRRELVRAELVVPHHVAARWSSGRGHGADRWEPTFSARMTERVPRSAFRPAPPVDAALLSITRRGRPPVPPAARRARRR